MQGLQVHITVCMQYVSLNLNSVKRLVPNKDILLCTCQRILCKDKIYEFLVFVFYAFILLTIPFSCIVLLQMK
jgi:hypothetical protein